MFVKTKGMTIEEIVGVEMDYPAVLCKFADGLCDVCYVDYDCDKDGGNVVMKGYPVGHRYIERHHGAVVKAYEVILTEQQTPSENGMVNTRTTKTEKRRDVLHFAGNQSWKQKKI